MESKLFSELGLSPEILKAIDKLGFEKASPIQAAAIPILLQGHDIVGQSQTGSGKTAAFAVPVIEKIVPEQRNVQALILCPTRELAIQVSEEFHKLTLFKRGITALPIYGGQSYERQFWGLKQGAQIVIGTPGRVMDHMRRGTLRLQTVKFVVLDEADVMLNMGFREDIETILKSVPKERQTVFFSATMPRPIRELIEKYARTPQNVQIEQKAMTVPTVEQVYYEVDRRYKVEVLTRLIDIHDLKLGIIFCNTKRMVDDLVDHLEAAGYMADRLHGDMTQAMRDRVMQKFRKSGLDFLVATDVAARGIDVDDVEVVFNYDLPYDGEDYVHRIGRTGRAGRKGRAISFVSGRELFQIRNIERYTNVRIQRAKIPTPDEVESAKANVFLEKLRGILQSGEFPKQDHLVERLLEEGFNSTDIVSALMHLLQDGENQQLRAPRVETQQRPDRPERQERPDRPPFRDREDRRLARPASRPATQIPVSAARPLPTSNAPVPSKPAPVKLAAPASAPVVAAKKIVTPPPAAKAAPVPPPAPKVAAAPAKPSPPPVAPISSADLAPVAAVTPAEGAVLAQDGSAPAPALKGKASRATPENFTKLFINVGLENGLEKNDVITAIMGNTGLPAKVIGNIDIRDRHVFVDVAADAASGIISKLRRAEIVGKRIKIKEA
jgi:ATP-dependent RNA helicase DeaD